jgi:hypothetical protein
LSFAIKHFFQSPSQNGYLIIGVNSMPPNFTKVPNFGKVATNALPDKSNYPYLRPMRLPNILLSVAVILAASLANAQQFKVIKETVDYKMMEVDSGYFFSHGIVK